MKPTQDHQTMEFEDGRSANVSIYQSDKGTMVLVTHDASNPFNHGEELVENRKEIADSVSKSLNVDPRELHYVEQAGQHYQTVPLERSDAGNIQIPGDTRIMHEPAAKIDAAISEHQSEQINPEVAQTQDWASHLKHPPDHSFNP